MSYHAKHMKYQLSPLTEENLLKMNDDTRTNSTYDAIERYYCSSGNEAPTHHHQPRIQTQTRQISPSQHRQQPRSRRASRDVVMESPRLLPFPYHNDCHFLPTAEHKQHQQKKKMGTGSFSDLSLHSQRTSVTAASPSSTTTIPLAYSARRAASTPPHSTRRSSALRRSSSASTCQGNPSSEPSMSSSSSSFSSASSFYRMGSSFFARLLDLMKKKNKSSHPSPSPSPSPSRSSSSASARLPKKNLVWFAEFAVNPPPPDGMMVAAA